MIPTEFNTLLAVVTSYAGKAYSKATYDSLFNDIKAMYHRLYEAGSIDALPNDEYISRMIESVYPRLMNYAGIKSVH